MYLWNRGLGLAGLSLLIGISGFAFALSLGLWQRWSTRWPLRRLITLTFILEIALVSAVGIATTIPGMALFATDALPAQHGNAGPLVLTAIALGICNGLYNGFFWTTQRTLFLQQLGRNDTGSQYGNFQIFVALFLKAGILIGGVLLDHGGFIWLLAISAGLSAVSAIHLAEQHGNHQPLHAFGTHIGTRQSLKFTDHRGSRQTFAIDGIFLYLESHLWTLSLFLVVKQDFARLGVAVVLLALGFALLFYLIKNAIDKIDLQRVYQAAVLVYAISWLLRYTLSEETSDTGNSAAEGSTLIITLLLITFFSSFFRLIFNKRFFDIAKNEGAVQYLLLKSYSSQWILGAFYTCLGLLLFVVDINTQLVFQIIYVCAAILTLAYLGYRDRTA